MSIVTFGDAALRFSAREGKRFETARDVALHVDGMTSTAAAVASRLGGDAVWLSKLQDTPLGRRVVTELNEHGLETDVVWADPDDGRHRWDTMSTRQSRPTPKGATTEPDAPSEERASGSSLSGLALILWEIDDKTLPERDPWDEVRRRVAAARAGRDGWRTGEIATELDDYAGGEP
jgi:sugar/nucleoside kinase (ribokinase family)